jgi:hypothetical protein
MAITLKKYNLHQRFTEGVRAISKQKVYLLVQYSPVVSSIAPLMDATPDVNTPAQLATNAMLPLGLAVNTGLKRFQSWMPIILQNKS